MENKINKFDWRLQSVSTVLKDQWSIKKWDYLIPVWKFKLKWTTITINMPNFCALYLDMAHKLYFKSNWYLVFKNFKNNRPINHEELFSFIQDRISNVIFSFTWLEAFLNENIWTIENYDKNYRYRYIDIYTKKQTEKWINKIIDDFSINQKINVIYDFYEIEKNNNIDENIKKISKFRSRLIHFKRKDTISFKVWDWTIFNDLLDKDFQDYSVLVYEIVDFFIKNSKKDKCFSAYWYERSDNCFKKVSN